MSAPADRHERAALHFAEWAGGRLPGVGVAVGGSVASGTHRSDSDLDLLVAHPSFRRSTQFTLRLEGVPAAVLCLAPGDAEARAREWTFGSGPGRWLAGMIRSARILADPQGVLHALRQRAHDAERDRVRRQVEVVGAMRAEGQEWAARLRAAPGVDARAALRLLTITLEGWNLLHGVGVDSKAANRATITRIRSADSVLAELLDQVIPISPASREPLLDAFERVFDPGVGRGPGAPARAEPGM